MAFICSSSTLILQHNLGEIHVKESHFMFNATLMISFTLGTPRVIFLDATPP